MTNISKVFKEEINVSDSEKFLTVKEAAVELQLKVGQIKHLISQNLIDSKLENDTSIVNVNSIDELVMIDLKKGTNVYPIRKNYKLKSNKTIDKKMVINSIIDGVNNLEEKDYFEYKRDFERICGNYSINYDISKLQSWVHRMIAIYHNNKIMLCFPYEKYTIVFLKNKDSEYEKYFYFVPSENFLNRVNAIDILIFIQKDCSDFTDENCKNFFNEKLSEYVYENHLFYLTLDEFIKEFSPTKYYEKNKLWSMYLDQTEYVAEEAANDEEIKELYMVNGFTRNQPYGSRKNPQYKKIWIDPFERGRQKVKKAA